MWFIYIIRCSDGTLYTGITTNIERRIHQHNTSKKGAKYTRNRRPVQFVFSKIAKNKSEASQEEYRIKQLSRREKEEIIASKKEKAI